MAWQISSKGFLMTLTGFVPDLIKQDFERLVTNALSASGIKREEITHWCIHPGGKKILDTIVQSLGINTDNLQHSYKILQEYGNMSSATIVFVLKEMFEEFRVSGEKSNARIFGAAFGPSSYGLQPTAHSPAPPRLFAWSRSWWCLCPALH